MSGSGGTCEYVLDPDEPDTWGGKEGDRCYVESELLNENNVWSCPHASLEDQDLCIFHLPIDKKDNEETIDSFLEIINNINSCNGSETQQLQFLGAKFAKFNLYEQLPDLTDEDDRLWMNHAKIVGGLDWSDVSFHFSEIILSGIKCNGNADFSEAEFGGNADFRDSQFKGETNFGGVNFGGGANFTDVEFRGNTIYTDAIFETQTHFYRTEFDRRADFRYVEFAGDTDFREAKFGKKVNFRLAEFGTDSNFSSAVFGRDTNFREVQFGGDTNFSSAKFDKGTKFTAARFDGNTNFSSTKFDEETKFTAARFDGNTTFSGSKFGRNTRFKSAKFGGESRFREIEFNGNTDFRFTEFGGNADFHGTEFGRRTLFHSVEFDGHPVFSGLELSRTQFPAANLTDAVFSDTNLSDTNFEGALLSRATFFGADLRGAKISGAVLGDVRIDEDTKFLGHPSDDSDTSPHTLSAIRSRPTCVYDPDYEEDNEHEDVDKAKSVYRALEELGGKHARPRLQARSFVRRQDLQKQDYWDDATADNASLEERLIAGARWSQAKLARATLLYGESPWRVIAWSLGIILSFAFLYPLGGWMKPADGGPITYVQIASNPVEILNSIYYSTLTYTALGFGDFQPVGLGRLLTTIETGLGAVMLALLVFILGRRAAR